MMRTNYSRSPSLTYRVNPAPLDLQTLWILMMAKYGMYDVEVLKVKMDAIRQESRQCVQLYYDRLE